ncbi:MAG: type II toxin-antitoxin system RelE/ParE family toxin [Planctomycetia bacterium]|nr:type II toxin-antitoxin system RelE/ParE family toxin [Planctomycetia bacterium]
MTRRKPRELRWVAPARDDLAAIVEHIAQRAPDTAKEFAERLLDHVEILAHQPHVGSICESYPKARYLVHGNFVIYYTVHRQEVVVRAVVRGARLFRADWLRRQ